jgi:transcriptional regulator with XRE-family HTH domain
MRTRNVSHSASAFCRCAILNVPSRIVTNCLRFISPVICDTENVLLLMAMHPFVMNTPYTQALRLKRRSAALTQDDVARILGTGGRSYVAMLESGDRVPHVRDTILLSMLFGTSESEIFPPLYLTTKDLFQSNVRKLIEESLRAGEAVDSDRLRFLRDALTNAQLSENVTPLRV